MTNPVYLDKDEILSITCKLVEEAFSGTDHRWHPEDAYYQIDSAIKYGFTALNHLTYMRHSK